MSTSRSAQLAGVAAVAAAVLALFVLLADDAPSLGGGAGTPEQLGGDTDAPVALDTPVAGGRRPGDRPELTTDVGPVPDRTPGPAPAADAGVAIEVWTGKVRTPDGAPVPGADVGWLDPGQEQAGGFLLETDHRGQFLLDRLPPGPLLVVSADGYAEQVVPVGDAGREVVIVLLPRRTVLGDVVAAEDGRALAGARVEAESASWRGVAETDATGRFRLEPPEGESLILFVSYPQRVSRVQDEADGLTVQLEQGRTVRGTVVGPTGQPFEGQVFVYGGGQLTRPQEAFSDGRGRFEVQGIDAEEEVSALAFAEGFASPWELSWQPPGSEDLQVLVVACGSLTVTGAPAGLLTLRAINAPLGTGRARRQPEAGVDPLGGLEAEQRTWRQLPPGSYQLELDGRTRGPVVPVASGEDARLSWRAQVLELEADVDDPDQEGSLRLQVLVLDAGGAPVEDATVVASFGQTQRQVRSDARGAAVFERLPERPLTFTATQPGRVLLRPEFVDPSQQQGEHVVLTLARPVALSGQLVPSSSAQLRLSLLDPEEVLLEVRAGDDGAFELGGLAPASYRLEVEADGYLPVDMQVSLPLPGPLRIELQVAEHRHSEDDDHDH